MSRRGNCWDNAVAESFFATLKIELDVHDTLWPTRGHAQGEVFEYIEAFYNGERRHSALAYLSPLAFERQWAATQGTLALSQPIAGRTPHHPSSIETPGATRTRGAAISVSPNSSLIEPITRRVDTLEVGALTPSAPQRSAP